MNLLKISTHSLVDVITNSSSELFVCNTDKTVRMVKELLKQLLVEYDRGHGGCSRFGDVFGEIEVAKYTSLPCSELGWDGNRCATDRTRLNEKEAAESKRHPKAFRRDDSLSREEKEVAWREWLKAKDAIWTEYSIKRFKLKVGKFIEFLKLNKIPLEKECQLWADGAVDKWREEKAGEYGRWFERTMSVELSELWVDFELYSVCGIPINKGDILINSKTDNSIPYELFDDIGCLFNAQSYHLG